VNVRLSRGWLIVIVIVAVIAIAWIGVSFGVVSQSGGG
jgi:hypothetical protein